MGKKAGLKQGFVFILGPLQEILWLKLNIRSNRMIEMVTSDARHSAELHCRCGVKSSIAYDGVCL